MKKFVVLCASIALILSCCTSKDSLQKVRVAASDVPHAEMLRFIKPAMRGRGYDLIILDVDDYRQPNKDLAEGKVDANFFQHLPYLEAMIDEKGYQITCFAKIHIEPLAIYSAKIHSIKDITPGSTIAIPKDPANQYRALTLLSQEGLITLKKEKTLRGSLKDVETNPLALKFEPMQADKLTKHLHKVTAAIIPTNYALEAHLNPNRDGLAIESATSPYVNVLAIQTGNENNLALQTLREQMLSNGMRTFIEKEYKGAIVPVLTECDARPEENKEK